MLANKVACIRYFANELNRQKTVPSGWSTTQQKARQARLLLV
jgi:hypothetical protein